MGTLLSIHLDVLKKIYKSYLNHNDRKMLLWSVGIKMPFSGVIECRKACRYGHINILQWLDKQGKLFVECFSTAAKYGQIEVLEWAKENNFDWRNKHLLCIYAAQTGQIETLKWLRKNGEEWNCSTQSTAAAEGHFETVKWLNENECPKNCHTFSWACRSGNIEMISWMKENNYPYTDSAYTYAARQGHVKVLVWLKENGFPANGNILEGYNLSLIGDDVLEWIKIFG